MNKSILKFLFDSMSKSPDDAEVLIDQSKLSDADKLFTKFVVAMSRGDHERAKQYSDELLQSDNPEIKSSVETYKRMMEKAEIKSKSSKS